MKRVPVHLVTGAERTLGRALIARCSAARADWETLELASCPCCTGRAELQVKLVRLLRERHPARVLVGFVEPAHRAAFERVLASWPLAQYIVPARALSVPEDAELTAEMLEGS